jgi:hypothetical protein
MAGPRWWRARSDPERQVASRMLGATRMVAPFDGYGEWRASQALKGERGGPSDPR